MNIKILNSFFILACVLFGFQNCGNFSAQNANLYAGLSSEDTDGNDVRDMEKRTDIDQLYYYFGLSKNKEAAQAQYFDALFDLTNKKVNLTLKLKDNISEIKKTLSLSDADVAKIKEATQQLQLDSKPHIDSLKGDAEEYIISYFSDQSSYIAHLETLKDQIEGLSIKDGKALLTQTLTEILAKKLDLSWLQKFTSLLEKKAELKSLVARIKEFLKSIKITIVSSGTLTIKINSGVFQSEIIKEI
ncbi:MAG: hypothetical protein M9899_00165 [Bdellovibrionaceae bacterium]|nr:hypothetical protein [Pseudobdellovibrionaceae bacterium]